MTDQGAFKCSNPLVSSKIKDLPWPYNLLACLNAEFTGTAQPIDYQVSAEHARYIDEVVASHLTRRKSACIFGFFRDSLSSEEIGRQVGVSRSRIAYNIHEALRDLHRPVVREKLLYGSEAAGRQDALQRRLAELDLKEQALDRRAEALRQREVALQRQEEALGLRTAAIQEHCASRGLEVPLAVTGTPEWPDIYSMAIEQMDLSTRAYNCLTRSKHQVVGDVVESARQGKLDKVRNLGEHTLIEILNEVKRLTGEDFTQKSCGGGVNRTILDLLRNHLQLSKAAGYPAAFTRVGKAPRRHSLLVAKPSAAFPRPCSVRHLD